MISQRTHENRVREMASRFGYRISKSRQRPHLDNQGELMLVDDQNHLVLGDRYDASLEAIEDYLKSRAR